MKAVQSCSWEAERTEYVERMDGISSRWDWAHSSRMFEQYPHFSTKHELVSPLVLPDSWVCPYFLSLISAGLALTHSCVQIKQLLISITPLPAEPHKVLLFSVLQRPWKPRECASSLSLLSCWRPLFGFQQSDFLSGKALFILYPETSDARNLSLPLAWSWQALSHLAYSISLATAICLRVSVGPELAQWVSVLAFFEENLPVTPAKLWSCQPRSVSCPILTERKPACKCNPEEGRAKHPFTASRQHLKLAMPEAWASLSSQLRNFVKKTIPFLDGNWIVLLLLLELETMRAV